MDIKRIRQKNTISLIDKYGRDLLAEKAGYQDKNYLNQISGGFKNMRDNVARKFEENVALSFGWMDFPHPSLWGQDDPDTQKAHKMMLEELQSTDLSILFDKASEILSSRDK